MAADDVSLSDKYRLTGARALVTGRQALVRLPLLQRELDRRAGLNTAGFISGYRGSPLGGYDAELWKAADELAASDIIFRPGLNEDLALTAVAGTQQLDFIPGSDVEGVFGIWYGKGPGVDRSGDAIRHANLKGVAPTGGVLLVFGDDHAGKSSTTAHQSDLTLASWETPVLYPSTVPEIVTLGLAGFAMSRFSGLLVGLKLVNETAETTSVLELDEPPCFISPDIGAGPDGVHIRPEMRGVQAQDMRLVRWKLPRAQAFARANRLDRIAFGSDQPRLLLAAAGKTWADTLAALDLLGISHGRAEALGLSAYKITLLYPLEPSGLFEAAAAAEEIVFIEEKRAHAELQAKQLFYDRAQRPRISGKSEPDGAPLLPADTTLDATLVAAALSRRLRAVFPDIEQRVPGFAQAEARVRSRLEAVRPTGPTIGRRPAFCPGCPHNTSTQVPEGSFGATGIGCHGMVAFQPERNPLPLGHMGGEGAHWIGMAPFTRTSHIFQNLGDGTYSHSGSLAIRAAVQARVNITFKILFNDAVAMTGGQPVEGGLTVARVVAQVRAEGVARIVVVSDDPDRFAGPETLPAGTELRHRDELAEVQNALKGENGVSVLVYDQVCAAEKRRRRKAGAYPDPDRRIFINAEVCEGCGDCSAQSNCVAIQPLETELGRKRRIDQSACNKDVSCAKGLCPSFVILEGARPRRRTPSDLPAAGGLPEPQVPPIGDGFDLVIAGVGGTGVVTVSAILGMAARLEGLGASLYDMTGLSQKGGQVFSHVRLRPDPSAVVAARVGPEEADLLLACDLVAGVQPEALGAVSRGRTAVVGNSDIAATADFQASRDFTVPRGVLTARLAAAAGRDPFLLAAASLSEQLFGDAIAANLILLGYAWQRGLLPLSRASIERAIALNGKAVKANLEAFAAGRRASDAEAPAPQPPQALDAFIARRAEDLARYWNSAYAARYASLMASALQVTSRVEGGEALAWAIARSAYKLMAYKDEYEVARLYSDGRFKAAVAREFDGVRQIRLSLAPPLFAKLDPVTGRPVKSEFGPWMFTAMGWLAKLKAMRESPLDFFGRTPERTLERALRDAYLAVVPVLLDRLPGDLQEAVEVARAPLEVRGYGPVKAKDGERVLARLRAIIGASG